MACLRPAGAIRAAYYLDGVTDPSTWSTQLSYPAPWGEIGSRKFAVASPKYSLVAMVSDPTAVAAYWDKVRREGTREGTSCIISHVLAFPAICICRKHVVVQYNWYVLLEQFFQGMLEHLAERFWHYTLSHYYSGACWLALYACCLYLAMRSMNVSGCLGPVSFSRD